MTAKELLVKVKALFDMAPGAASPAPGDVAPADTGAAGTVYTLADGITQISVVQAGATPAIGDMVTVGGLPPAAGVLTLIDGSSMTVDATGAITAYTPAAPVTVDPLGAAKPAAPATTPAAPAATPAPPKQFELTPESAKAMFDSFATGSSDERIANLEVVAKALMEYNFGWQIREAQQKATADQAINIYKQDLVTAQAALAKQDKQIKGLFELMETMVELPTADPKTLTGTKKEKFNKAESREKKLEGFAEAIKKNKAEAAGK